MKFPWKSPSIKNVVMILIAILLVGGAFVVAEYRNQQAEIAYVQPIVSTSTDLQNLADSTDWKKILLANDKNSTTSVKDLTKSKEKLSQSDIFAREFFAKYMAASESGVADDVQVQQDIINQALSNNALVPTPQIYSYKDLKFISNQDNAEARRSYVTTVSAILAKYYPIEGTSEAEIAQNSFDKNDVSILEKIDPRITAYKNLLENLLVTSVPAGLVDSHVDLVNATSKLMYVAESLRKSGVDPLKGVQGLALYIDANTSFMASMDDLNRISQ